MTERRLTGRCPVCSGPTTSDPNHSDGLRCRNSACRQNHQQVSCPRCQAKDLAQAVFREGVWQFTCADCEHNWNNK